MREAAKRRVDPAGTPYNDLFAFFKRGARIGEEPTEKQLKRDFNALEKGRKNRKLLIEKIKPQTTGGKHKVVDEIFKNAAEFKDTVEGKITE
ncbi:MAG: hypothetical protein LBC76_11100 [Treponema sp.]|nr:hypothetical protein [Treponema sp.]